jgi:GNAT superfamily N-acetyltransferase
MTTFGRKPVGSRRGSTYTLSRHCANSRPRGAVQIRSFTSEDLESVQNALAFLPTLYPGGDRWLEQRLSDVLQDQAICGIATVAGKLGGLTIETPKDPGIMKLSTFYVRPECRSRGVGFALLEASVCRWRSSGIHRAYVTVASQKVNELDRLLSSFGFSVSSVLQDRYGPNRDEFVYEWRSR